MNNFYCFNRITIIGSISFVLSRPEAASRMRTRKRFVDSDVAKERRIHVVALHQPVLVLVQLLDILRRFVFSDDTRLDALGIKACEKRTLA